VWRRCDTIGADVVWEGFPARLPDRADSLRPIAEGMAFHPTQEPGAGSRWPVRIAVAALTAALAVVLTHLAWPVLQVTPFVLGLASSILSAKFQGRYAGFLATFFTAAGFTLFPAPLLTSRAAGALFGFVVVATAFSWLVARRYEIEATLRSSESRLAEAQHVAHIGSWEWDVRHNNVWWSEETYRVVGVEAGDFLPSYDAFMERVHPEDRTRLNEVKRRCFETRQPFEIEHRIIRSDGEIRTILSKARVVLGKTGEIERLLGILQDITDAKAAEEIVARSERRLKTIIDAQPACVKLVAPDGRLLEMNSAGLRMLGVSDISQIRDRPVADVVHPEDRDKYLAAHRAASAGSAGRLEFRIFNLDGKEYWVDSHMVPFDAFVAGDEPGWPVLSVTSDITDRKQLEEQLRQAQKMEAIGRLAGGIAHDFNNLLTVISGFTETAIREIGDDTVAAGDLRQVHKAAEAAATLTRQMLLFSRKQTGGSTAVNLNTVISQVEQLLRRTLGEHIQIDLRLALDVAAVRGDASQLQQVIMNLAVNARDAMPTGGLLIIETSNIHVEGRLALNAGLAPGEYVQLTVADSGHGMTREVKARIFEPFFTTKPVGRGTGLGLSTVYGIVQSVGGTIAVTSDVGRGTSFKLYFPTAPVRAERTDMLISRRPDLPTGDETIVLVEDDSSVRAFAGRVLRMAGYNVLEADSPARGLELIEDDETRVDAMLTDIIMPGMNGCELAKRVWTKRPHLPVLYMSGYTDQVLREQDMSLDECSLLEKPFTASQLLGKIREVLGAKQEAVAVGSVITYDTPRH
jgi:two-component system, cell cycle sensor histidine kinase and response regulator CckA